MQLLAAQYCPLPTHRRVEAIANRQPPRPSLGGVRQIDHVAMCGSERSLRSYTIVGRTTWSFQRWRDINQCAVCKRPHDRTFIKPHIFGAVSGLWFRL